MNHQPCTADLLAAIDAGDDERTEQVALRLTPQDEPVLIELLSSAGADYRWWALRGLAVCGSAQSLPGITAQLDDPDAGVRAAALLALSHVHRRYPADVAPRLDRAAQALCDDDGMVRQVAADSLAQCGNDAVPALARVLFEQEHEGARTRAAGALRKIATMPAAGVLYAVLNDRNHLVRAYAYEGLDEMGLLETILVTLE